MYTEYIGRLTDQTARPKAVKRSRVCVPRAISNSRIFPGVVDSSTYLRVLECESRRKQRRLVEQHHEVLDRLVVFVGVRLVFQRLDDGMVGVDLEVFLGRHVTHRARVTQRLRLHYALHVRRPAVLTSHYTAW